MSLVLGVISIVTICLVYPALICGSLAITFALLSRGGEFTLTNRAKAGLALGIVGLGTMLLILAAIYAIGNIYFDGVEDMMRQVYATMGIDYDALLRSMSN